ncbi:alpha/beta hydrolase-fold protein [Kingella kingae]|nr:alpha/beta hydrolase-fold protein [Kingella kingae]MDK4649762.1 alpha/beta hydrolase-fold protein [Kingella kingae]
MQTLQIHGKNVLAFLPEQKQPALGVFYTFPDSEAEAEQLAQSLPANCALIAIFEPDWEQHFTPWTAPRLFKKGTDFGGGAAAYHDALTQVWIPEIEQVLSLDVAWRGILGYSLAGLFALYNAYCAPYFDYVACVSGSLWFDGWLDFAQKNTPAKLPKAMYFSLGDTEANSKNPRMATVQAALEQTAAQWQPYACPSALEINQGGHFDDVPQRLAKAAQWLMQAA